MRVQELIEKRAKVWETAKNFVDTHEDKNGNLSAEDKETYQDWYKAVYMTSTTTNTESGVES